jgi:hypothetical protein
VCPGPKVQTDAEITGKFYYFTMSFKPNAQSEYADWVKSAARSAFREHISLRLPATPAELTLDTVGTLSMLPKDKGGVVDPSLKA